MDIFKYVYLAYLTTFLSLDIESISTFLPSQIIYLCPYVFPCIYDCFFRNKFLEVE